LAACAAPPAPTAAPPTRAPLATPAVAATTVAGNTAPGATPAAPSPATPSPSSGQFVYATGEGNIILLDAATLKPKAILQGSATEIDDSPTFSPDGKQIVYITHVLDPKAPTNEIRAMNLDGSNARPLFKPPAAQASRLFPTFPRYSADGNSIYFSLVNVSGNAQVYQVARGPASGGNWNIVVADGHMPSPSRDGKLLAFARINAKTFMAGIWLANADGSNAKLVVPDDIFLAVTGLSISPDGQWIAFAASGPPQKKLPGSQLPIAESEPTSCALGAWIFCFVTRASANGLPWEVWLVSTDGKMYKQLTRQQLDSPWPAFSKDGRYLAYISFTGLFVIDRQTNGVTKLSDDAGHGVMDWYQK
jgi:Tol biopolymer transport system component